MSWFNKIVSQATYNKDGGPDRGEAELGAIVAQGTRFANAWLLSIPPTAVELKTK